MRGRVWVAHLARSRPNGLVIDRANPGFSRRILPPSVPFQRPTVSSCAPATSSPVTSSPAASLRRARRAQDRVPAATLPVQGQTTQNEKISCTCVSHSSFLLSPPTTTLVDCCARQRGEGGRAGGGGAARGGGSRVGGKFICIHEQNICEQNANCMHMHTSHISLLPPLVTDNALAVAWKTRRA